MLKIFLEPEDIESSRFFWRINKLAHVKKSTELLAVEVSWKVFELISCWDAKFVVWSRPRWDHDSQDSH